MNNPDTNAQIPNMPSTVSVKDIRFKEAAAIWLEAIEEVRKRSTYVRYSTTYEVRIKPYLDDMYLHELTGEMIHDCILRCNDEISKQKPNAGYVRDTLNVISWIIQFSAPDISFSSLTRGIMMPKKTKSQVETFTFEEQKRLSAVLFDQMDSFKLGVLMCLCTGLRLGEICALQTNDIDCLNRQIHVQQSVQRIRVSRSEVSMPELKDTKKTMLLVSDPKSTNSLRSVPLADGLYHLIMENFPKGTYFLNGDHLMEPRTYEYKYKKYLELAEIPHKKFHTLRHTFATNCIENGMNPKVLSEILGHANVNITLNRYVHPTQQLKKEQINQVMTKMRLY